MANMTVGSVRQGKVNIPMSATSSTAKEGQAQLKSNLTSLKDNYQSIETKIVQETMKQRESHK